VKIQNGSLLKSKGKKDKIECNFEEKRGIK
jgi:hypothetical protein